MYLQLITLLGWLRNSFFTNAIIKKNLPFLKILSHPTLNAVAKLDPCQKLQTLSKMSE